MLLRTLFLLLLLTALTETMIHGAHALAQATLRRQALVAVHDRLDAATTTAGQVIAAAIEAGADPRTIVPAAPSPAASCALASENGCALEATASIAFGSASAETPSPCPSGACTVYMQGNDEVSEGRIHATIAAQAITSGGAVLASRATDVTFRTLAQAPYSALAGEADGSFGALDGAGPGDDGGALPMGAAPGSLIGVIYENRSTGATMPANVWQPQVQNPGIAPVAWLP